MSSTRFHCAICGTGLSVGAESTGSIIECPACRHVVPVPARWPGATESLALLPKGVLALEIKFLCPECSAKLRTDARLQGEAVHCPKCTRAIRVPHWSSTPAGRPPESATPTAELSEAEIEFLSGPQEMKSVPAATG